MKVILISGHAGSGKDTTASILESGLKKEHFSVLICHYADLVKYVCRTFFHWDGVKDVSGRTLLQYVGTDVIREHDPNYWVRFLSDMLHFFEKEWDYVLIPDTRFPNEISVMKQQFDTLHLRINRGNYTGFLTEAQRNHPSETSLDDAEPDYWIQNSGTKEDLEKEVRKFITEVL